MRRSAPTRREDAGPPEHWSLYTLEISIRTVVLSLGVAVLGFNPAQFRLGFLTLGHKGFLKAEIFAVHVFKI